MMPIVIELLVLGLLSIGWLAFHDQVNRFPLGAAYHVAAHRRDTRKAKFYFFSVWVGLVVAFLSARSLEALSGQAFDSPTQRAWILGSLRGIEMWGLLMIGAVWARVGKRVALPNSDGQSLIPVPEEKPKR